jgi:hypothetical protein
VHFEFLNGGKVVRDPDWSLGHFSETRVVRENGDRDDKTSPIVKVRQI